MSKVHDGFLPGHHSKGSNPKGVELNWDCAAATHIVQNEPNWPGGVAVKKKKKNISERPRPSHHISSPIHLKLDTQVQHNVIYKKKIKKITWTIKVCLDGFFFANLHHQLKRSNVTSTLWILTVSTPKLIYSIVGLRYTLLLKKKHKVSQKNMAAINFAMGRA